MNIPLRSASIARAAPCETRQAITSSNAVTLTHIGGQDGGRIDTPYRLLSIKDMMNLPFGTLLTAVQQAAKFGQVLTVMTDEDRKKPVSMPQASLESLLRSAETAAKCCGEIGMPVAASAYTNLREFLLANNTPTPNREDFVEFKSGWVYEGLTSRVAFTDMALGTESRNTIGLMLNAKQKELFEGAFPLFGEAVSNSFPSLIDECAEAGKCLALNRATAAAFHLLRCLEAGIIALGRSLSISDAIKGADRNWSVLLRELKKAISVKYPDQKAMFTADGTFYEDMHTRFELLKNPYRNATMHLDKSFTMDQVWLIHGHVKGIMEEISSRMDEQGVRIPSQSP